MVAAFPLGKLASLAVKQISKPVARAIADTARRNDFFKRYVCTPPARLYNWSQTQIKMRFLGSTGRVKVRALSEDVAVDLGAQLIAETTIFTIAALTIVAEYTRSANASEKKEAAKAEEMQKLHEHVDELGLVVEQQNAELRELRRFQGTLHTALTKKGMKDLPSLGDQSRV